MIDRYGNELKFVRDINGNLLKVISPNGRYIQFVYDGANRVIQATDNLGRTVSYTYDDSGRLATVTDPAGNVESYNYDLNNNMISVVDKNGITKVVNQYDSNGRVAKQTYADGSSDTFSYSVKDNAYIESILNVCQGTALSPQTGQTGSYGDYPVSCTAGPDGRVYQTDVTDGRGIVKRLQFNNAGYLRLKYWTPND